MRPAPGSWVSVRTEFSGSVLVVVALAVVAGLVFVGVSAFVVVLAVNLAV
jgi:hypothetical protein